MAFFLRRISGYSGIPGGAVEMARRVTKLSFGEGCCRPITGLSGPFYLALDAQIQISVT